MKLCVREEGRVKNTPDGGELCGAAHVFTLAPYSKERAG